MVKKLGEGVIIGTGRQNGHALLGREEARGLPLSPYRQSECVFRRNGVSENK